MTPRLPASFAVIVCLASPTICLAQTLASTPLAPVSLLPTLPTSDTATVRPEFEAPRAEGFWGPLKAVPGDFARFMSLDNAKMLGIVGAGALVASHWDSQSLDEARGRLPTSGFTAGNVGGGFLLQTGAAFGLYTVARVTGNDKLSAVGGDLVRAQILSQGIVQVSKVLAHRQRPDGSDNFSFPSGHTASAFATASVLQKYYGWKVGIPAYGFGAYVAAARMQANKHNFSDVLMGAAIGVAAAHTVTLGIGGAKFDLGVAPTDGGAAVMFTKKTGK
jgi:hypothetical protein